MPIYILVGPAAALIGIVAILFVMRNRQTQKRSMYSSRRAQVERKVKAARQRTLAPRGHSDRPPTEAEIAAAVPATAGSIYQAPPAAPRQAWEAPATPTPAFTPSAPVFAPPPAPDLAPPPPPPEFTPAAEIVAAPVAPPEWNPAPADTGWTPSPVAPADLSVAPPAEPPAIAPAPAPAPEPISSTPAGGGASWEIVGAPSQEPAAATPAKGRKDRDRGQAHDESPWQLSSGQAPAEGEEGDEESRKPSAAMALAQYAVLVVGLVMVLIGVLVMVANSKVT